jgi:hypothetical protein
MTLATGPQLGPSEILSPLSPSHTDTHIHGRHKGLQGCIAVAHRPCNELLWVLYGSDPKSQGNRRL